MNCQFHPIVPAENHCDHCRANFCGQCSDTLPRARIRDHSSACFVCGGALTPLAAGNQIIPFWSRIGDIYRYPLSVQALITILVISTLSTLLRGFGLLAVIPSVAIVLYSFACLRRTASGENEAPDVDASFQGSIMPVFYAGVSTSAAAFVIWFVFESFGTGMGILLSFFVGLLMPAAIIIIAVQGKLFPALHPGNQIEIVKATGISYFVMLLFIAVMVSSTAVLSGFLARTSFASMNFFMTSVISNYYSIVVYHIMGYLVYQNHAELGYHVSGSAGVKHTNDRSETQREKIQLEMLIKAGKFDAARGVAKRILQNDASMWEWARAFKLFCAAQPSKDVDLYFERYVDKLISLDETEKIADAYLDIVRVKPSFEPASDARKLDIADALHHIGKHTQAVRLIQKLVVESNDHDTVGRALLLLVSGFRRLPGSGKHLAHYENLHKLHLAKSL